MRSRRTAIAAAAILAPWMLTGARPAPAQVEAWRTQYDSELSDVRAFFGLFGLPSRPSQVGALAVDGGHYAVVSVWDDRDSGLRGVLTRHDAMGELSWTRSLESSGIGDALAVDDFGNAYLATGDSETCATVWKVSALGEVLWKAVADDLPSCEFGFNWLAVSGGFVYAVGTLNSAEGIVVARFAADGAHDWSFVREVDPESQSLAFDAAVDSAGALLVAGTEWNPTVDYLLLKVTSDGELDWARTFDGGNHDVGWSVAVGVDDRVTISGVSAREVDLETGNVLDYYTIQYDAAGNQRWAARVERETYVGPFWWTPISPDIAVDARGDGVVLTGAVGPEGSTEFLLLKYGPEGTESFRKELPQYAEGQVVLVDEADRIYVGAPLYTEPDRQIAVISFAADGTLLWQENTDPVYYTTPASLSLRDDRLVVAATQVPEEGTAATEDVLWIGLDTDGNRLWEAGDPVHGVPDFHCGPDSQNVVTQRTGSCLVVSGQGAVGMAGQVTGPAPSFTEVRTISLGPDGALVWSREAAPATDNLNARANALALDPAGNLVVGGDFYREETGEPAWVVAKYDRSGEEQWTRFFEQGDALWALAADSRGAVYVAGTDSDNGFEDLTLIKYDADGNQGFFVDVVQGILGQFVGRPRHSPVPIGLLVTSDHRVIVTGTEAPETGSPFASVWAYDNGGQELWQRAITGSTGVAELPAVIEIEGEVVAAGRSANVTGFDALVVRIDASGNVVWRRDLEGVGEGDDSASAVAVDPDGNAYVAGRTWNGDDFDVLVVKLDPAGNELWRRAVDLGHGDDEAWSAAFDGPGPGRTAGSLWIAGRASNGSDTDALTLRLDADGDELFRDLAAGTEQRDDEHYDLVIGPVAGHVTVAGVSAEIDESYNFQAIRYVTSPLDVDYDGEAGALTDGLLIQRWLFGFHGSVLENGAVDQALCARCPAEQIDLHLSAIVKLLDVDGDGAAESLTDGTLIFRWLFGFRGATLVSGAVDLAHCTRCDAQTIETHLSSLQE